MVFTSVTEYTLTGCFTFRRHDTRHNYMHDNATQHNNAWLIVMAVMLSGTFVNGVMLGDVATSILPIFSHLVSSEGFKF